MAVRLGRSVTRLTWAFHRRDTPDRTHAVSAVADDLAGMTDRLTMGDHRKLFRH